MTQNLDLDAPEPKGPLRSSGRTSTYSFCVAGPGPRKQPASPNGWVPSTAGPTVGDRFDISVGPLVDYRSPRKGPRVPYLVAKNFPVWGTVRKPLREPVDSVDVLHDGPFVVIPRTSRPGDSYRARAALVADSRGIAVENHLLVLRPRSGGASRSAGD